MSDKIYFVKLWSVSHQTAKKATSSHRLISRCGRPLSSDLYPLLFSFNNHTEREKTYCGRAVGADPYSSMSGQLFVWARDSRFFTNKSLLRELVSSLPLRWFWRISRYSLVFGQVRGLRLRTAQTVLAASNDEPPRGKVVDLIWV